MQENSNDSPNPSDTNGGKTELRGTWWVTGGPAIQHIPFYVTEVNFYNKGFYPVTVGFGNPIKGMGERNPKFEQLNVEAGEIVRDLRLKYPTKIFIILAKQRITKLYFLLKGEV